MADSPEQPNDSSYCIALGGALRDLRTMRGLKLRTVAASVRIAESTLSRCELGSFKPPFALLARLAEFYGMSLFALLLLVAKNTSPNADLPSEQHALLLWALLRYDEAQPRPRGATQNTPA